MPQSSKAMHCAADVNSMGSNSAIARQPDRTTVALSRESLVPQCRWSTMTYRVPHFQTPDSGANTLQDGLVAKNGVVMKTEAIHPFFNEPT
jgi:hypothetical protein